MKNTPEIYRRTQFWSACLMLGLAFAGSQVRWADGQPQNPAGQSAIQKATEFHLGKGYDALKNDRYEVAAQEFRAALAQDPRLVLRARFPLAVALFELHQPGDARREFEAVRQEVGDHPNVMYYLGRLDVTEGKFDDAVHELAKAVVDPPFPDTAYYLGFAYFLKGDNAAAERWLRQAAKQNPRDSRAFYQLGLLYRKTGRKEEAEKTIALSEAMRLREADESRLKLECSQKLDKGSLEEARDVCEQLYDPNDPQQLTMLGTIYGQHGDFQEALKPLRRAAELSPQAPQMQFNLALDYYHLKRFQEARQALEPAVMRWPDLFQINALFGAVLLRLGDNLSARRVLSRAHELNPRDAETTRALFAVLMELANKDSSAKQYPASLKYLGEAEKLRPNDPEPHKRMAEIYRLVGEDSRAEAERREAGRLRSTTPGPPNPNQ
jgi:Flp pilus assembly protein TadD